MRKFLIFLLILATFFFPLSLFSQTKSTPLIILLRKEDFVENRSKDEVYRFINIDKDTVIDEKYIAVREITFYNQNNEWITLRSYVESIHALVVVKKGEERLEAIVVTLNTTNLYTGVFLSFEQAEQKQTYLNEALLFQENVEEFLEVLDKKLTILQETSNNIDEFIAKHNVFFRK